MNTIDPRKQGLLNGLRQLNTEELQRVLNYTGEFCLDTYNYNEENATFCPLAVAIQLDKTVKFPTNTKIQTELLNRGFKIFNTRGISGNFYTDNRLADLILAANEVLAERG